MTARLAGFIFLGVLATILATGSAPAQEEFPPPQGKGRLVVVASGAMGMPYYSGMAKQIAQLGYDAVLVDGNAMEGTQGAGLKTAIEAAVRYALWVRSGFEKSKNKDGLLGQGFDAMPEVREVLDFHLNAEEIAEIEYYSAGIAKFKTAS